MLRTRTTRWSVGTAVLCLLLLVGAWLLLVSPRRSSAADLRDRNLTAQQQNAQLQARVEELEVQWGELDEYRAKLSGLLKQLPAGADMPQLARDLDVMATASGVTIDTLTPSAATAATPTTGAAPTAPTTGASGTGAGGTGAGGQAGPATATGVVQVPVSIVVHGDYFQAVAFLQKLQTQLPRALLVTGVQVTQESSGDSGTIQLSITGALFAWPAGAAAVSTAAATPTTTALPPATSGGTS